MSKHFSQALVWGLSSGMLCACGETVNYETREKLVATDAIQDLSRESANADAKTGENTADNVEPSFEVLCSSPLVQEQAEVLSFPEIPQGTTCRFGLDENLSRKDGWIRAYLRQNQDIHLPAGATLCGFAIDPTQKAMHYDDEMFFLIEDKILIATKDYTEYFPKEGLFHTFSWEPLKNQVYNQFDQRGLYCVGGDQGLSDCQLPPTDTTGSIELNFTAELSSSLAQLLQKKEVLHFSWITTGDNDDSDCRHTDISLPIVLRYLPASARP